MNIYLCAVKLPQAVTVAITSYKRSLFKARACVSALAFSPLIPLAWTQTPQQLPGNIPAPSAWEIIGSQPSSYGDAWYLPCGPESEIETLKRSLDFPDVTPGLFPVFPGIHAASLRDLSDPLDYTGPVRIDDFRLSVYEVSYTNSLRWYEDVNIRSVEQKHLR